MLRVVPLLMFAFCLSCSAAPVPPPRQRTIPIITPGLYRFIYGEPGYGTGAWFIRFLEDGTYRCYSFSKKGKPLWYGHWWYDVREHKLYLYETMYGDYYITTSYQLGAGKGKAKWCCLCYNVHIYQGWGEALQ